MGGGAGLVAGSGLRAELRALLPGHARAVLFGAVVGVLALWSAGAVLAALAVAVRGESVANVLARAWQDDRAKPIASAQMNVLIRREEAAAADARLSTT